MLSAIALSLPGHRYFLLMPVIRLPLKPLCVEPAIHTENLYHCDGLCRTVDGPITPAPVHPARMSFPWTMRPATHDVSSKHINDGTPHRRSPAIITDVSKISHPQLVRTFCHELTVYAVACGNGFPADGRTDLLPGEHRQSPITAM